MSLIPPSNLLSFTFSIEGGALASFANKFSKIMSEKFSGRRFYRKKQFFGTTIRQD